MQKNIKENSTQQQNNKQIGRTAYKVNLHKTIVY